MQKLKIIWLRENPAKTATMRCLAIDPLDSESRSLVSIPFITFYGMVCNRSNQSLGEGDVPDDLPDHIRLLGSRRGSHRSVYGCVGDLWEGGVGGADSPEGVIAPPVSDSSKADNFLRRHVF